MQKITQNRKTVLDFNQNPKTEFKIITTKDECTHLNVQNSNCYE